MATKKKTTKKVTKKPIAKKVMASSSAASKKASTKNTAKKVAKKAAKKVTKKSPAKKVGTTPVVKKAATKKKVAKKVSGKRVSRKKSNADNLIHGIEAYKAKAKEKYMNPKQVEHFKSILLAWKSSLLYEVSKTIHLMQDENINHPDPNDRASQETDMSLELRNRDRERKLLKKIDSTILRVENDDYGWCDRCGIEIGIRRLEARPTAELCVDCKTLNEIKERQMI